MTVTEPRAPELPDVSSLFPGEPDADRALDLPLAQRLMPVLPMPAPLVHSVVDWLPRSDPVAFPDLLPAPTDVQRTKSAEEVACSSPLPAG